MISIRISLLRTIPLALAIAFVVSKASGQTTANLASKPPMGWNSWNHFAERVTDADVRATADAWSPAGCAMQATSM